MPLTDLILTFASTSHELQKIRIKIRHMNQDKADEFLEVGTEIQSKSRGHLFFGARTFTRCLLGFMSPSPCARYCFFPTFQNTLPESHIKGTRYTKGNVCVCVCVCVCVNTYIHTYIHRFPTKSSRLQRSLGKSLTGRLRRESLRVQRSLGKSITTR